MTVAEILPRLESVYARGQGRWSALCPGHADRSPSLSISEGESGILLKCWAGCSVQVICESLGLQQKDLFFEALDADPSRRREAARNRENQRHARERHAQQQGTLIDALREADYFVQSRRGIDISTWSHDRLNDELNALADAQHLLESEDLHG